MVGHKVYSLSLLPLSSPRISIAAIARTVPTGTNTLFTSVSEGGHMSETVFDRETLLDLVVNAIPFAILAIFFVAYIVFTPFGFDSVLSSIQLAIIGVSALGLAVLTYYSGRAVSKAENEMERQEAAEALEGEGDEALPDGEESAEADADTDAADEEPAETDDETDAA